MTKATHPELCKVCLALKLAVDARGLRGDGGNGDAKRDNRVLENHKGALLLLLVFSSVWVVVVY